MATRARLATGAALSGLLIFGSLASGTAAIQAAKGGKQARPAPAQVHHAPKAGAKQVSFTGYLAAAPTIASTSAITTTAPLSATLTVLTGHGPVTVNVTDKTRVVRRFNGTSSLDELSQNDHLQVVGRPDGAQTVDASLIKDLSIENNDGLLFAKVTQVDTGSLTVVSARHGHHASFAAGQTFTLPISSTTTIIVGGLPQKDDSAIKQGDMVRVDGVFDLRSHTFASTKRVVDLSGSKGGDEETTTTTTTTSTAGTTTSTTTTATTTTTTTTTTAGATTTTSTTGATTSGTTSTTTAAQGLSVQVRGEIAVITAPATTGGPTMLTVWLHGGKYVTLPVTAATTVSTTLKVGQRITAIAVYDAASHSFTSVTSITVQA